MAELSNIPTLEPSSLTAGDTLIFKRTLTNFPASTWTATYYLIGEQKYSFTATADGDAHSVEVASTTTDDWAAGTYRWECYVSASGERYLVSTGSIIINPNPASTTYNDDARTHVKRVLDAIEAAIEGRASRTDLSYSIQGRSIQHMSPGDLIRWHSHYKSLYANEVSAQRINNGLASGNKIVTRFRE